VAAELADAYSDGVWLVELAPVTDATHVQLAIAGGLGVREEPPRSVLESLVDAVRDRELLLVLDNCEHVVDSAANVANELLRAAPGLRILATSREGLAIGGEVVFPVPSLSLPLRHHLESPEALLDAESARLFVERARAARADQSLSQRDVAAVAEICHRLDGIPLALELAAARTRVLGVAQIAERLDNRFRLLVQGYRTAPPRHQTLLATLDWSHDLLSAPERTLLRRLAVFSGGFSLESAERVCQLDEVVEHLGSLIDKSLVLADGGRYRMLQTVRQYAVEKLVDAGDHDRMRERHLEWCVALAEQAEADFRGARQAVRLDELDIELDNLRAALGWAAVRPGGAHAMLRIGAALWWFWRERGHSSEGRQWLERALSLEADADKQLRARELDAKVDKQLRARALDAAGALAHSQGAYAAARGLEEHALALWRELGDARGMSVSLNTLGIVAKAEGDHVRASELLCEMLSLARQTGDDARAATALNNLAALAIDQGDYPEARAALEESLTIKRRLGDRVGEVAALHNLGESAFRLTEYRDAARLLADAVALSREMGATPRLAQSLHSLGLTQLRLGDETIAVAHFQEGLRLFVDIGHEWGIALCLEGLSQAPSVRSDPALAIRLVAAATRWRESNGSPLPASEQPELDTALATARSALDARDADRAWSDGWSMPLEDAAAAAMALTVPASDVSPPPSLLTPRELEVAELVSRGLTNRQIGAVLHISKPTADRHVTNILTKLGVTTRAQIATWFVQRRA